MKDVKLPGIYKIMCIATKKIYIGSSVKPYSRFSRHKLELRNNKHSNLHLQNAWNKYGKGNFVFEILENCAKELLLEKEQYYINFLKPEFNIAKDVKDCRKNKTNDARYAMGSSMRGKHHKAETIKLMSESRKGIKNPMFGKHHSEEYKKQKSKQLKNRKITWNLQLKEARNKRPSQTYYVEYTLLCPDNQIKVLHTWKELQVFLKNYSNKKELKPSAERLIKEVEYKNFVVLKITKINTENKEEIIKFIHPNIGVIVKGIKGGFKANVDFTVFNDLITLK